MGIRSLSDYIDTNYPSIGNWFTIDSPCNEIWIVDANAIFYYLSCNNDDLQECISLILKFQYNLSKIKCIWVFDGESKLEKLPTQISRASNILKSSWIPLGLLSIMTLLFTRMGVDFMIAPGEADETIAHLAIKHDAYILSNDSDFYIYDTLGYIPLSHLTVSSKMISGKCIKIKEIAQMLGISIQNLPYFAVLVGNDLFTGVDPPYTKSKKTCRIKYWASRLKSCNTPVNNSLEFQNAVAQYNIPKSIQYQFCKDQDFTLAASQGRLDPSLLKLLHHKVFWCGNLLENVKKESAWDVSLQIRQNLYSFLFVKDTIITEYCRRGAKFTPKTFKVQGQFTKDTSYNLLFKSFGLDYELVLKIPSQFQVFAACLKSLVDYLYNKETPILDFQLNSLILSAVISWNNSKSKINSNPGLKSLSKTPSFIHLKAQMQILLFTFHLFQQSLWPLVNPFDVNSSFRLLEPSLIYHNLTMTRKGASVQKVLNGMVGYDEMFKNFVHVKELIMDASKDQISCL